MIKPGHDDLIPRLQISGQGAAHCQCESCHVCAEDDLLRAWGAKKVRRCLARSSYGLVGRHAASEYSSLISIRRQEIFAHALDNLLGDLRSGRTIKEDGV